MEDADGGVGATNPARWCPAPRSPPHQCTSLKGQIAFPAIWRHFGASWRLVAGFRMFRHGPRTQIFEVSTKTMITIPSTNALISL